MSFRDAFAGEIRELRDEAGDGATREFWRRHLFALDAAEIGTIHAFCGTILKEFAVQAGVGASFSVLDGQESKELLKSTAREAVQDAVARRDEGALRLLEGIELDVLCRLAATAVEEREKIAAYFRTLGAGADDPAALASLMKSAYTQVLSKAIVEISSGVEFETAVSIVESCEGPEGDRIEERRAAFVDAHDAFLEAPKEDLFEGFLGMYRTMLDLRGGSSKKWGEDLEEVREALKALRKLMEKTAEVVEAVLRLDWEQRARDITEFLSLAGKAADAYAEAKRRTGALDFNDLLISARDLVAARPDVTATLAKRWRFILVDEFQDTDHVQEELIARLAAAGSSIFVVGDPEQSIYAFRGAEVEVFSKVRSAFAKGAGALHALSGNYRSQPHIVAFVNTLFGRAMPAGSGMPEWRTPHAPLEAMRGAGGRRIEVICAESANDMTLARRIEAAGAGGASSGDDLAGDDAARPGARRGRHRA